MALSVTWFKMWVDGIVTGFSGNRCHVEFEKKMATQVVPAQQLGLYHHFSIVEYSLALAETTLTKLNGPVYSYIFNKHRMLAQFSLRTNHDVDAVILDKPSVDQLLRSSNSSLVKLSLPNIHSCPSGDTRTRTSLSSSCQEHSPVNKKEWLRSVSHVSQCICTNKGRQDKGIRPRVQQLLWGGRRPKES